MKKITEGLFWGLFLRIGRTNIRKAVSLFSRESVKKPGLQAGVSIYAEIYLMSIYPDSAKHRAELFCR